MSVGPGEAVSSQELIPDHAANEQAVGPECAPEDIVAGWMRRHYAYPEGSVERQLYDSVLERQLVSAYGLGERVIDEATGLSTVELSPRDQVQVRRRMQLLGYLAASDADPVDRARAESFAYDFYHLLHKEVTSEDRHLRDEAARVEAEEARAKAYWQAAHDPLTGLNNRLGMKDAASSMIARAEAGEIETIALLFIDLDRFKMVNDTPGLGHEAGDRILQGAARVLENQTRRPTGGREPDLVVRAAVKGELEQSKTDVDDADNHEAESVRLGGDEFAVLFPFDFMGDEESEQVDNSPEGRAERIAERVTTALTEYLERATERRISGIGASIGYVIWKPGMSVDAMMRLADKHMYEVKASRKGSVGDSSNADPETLATRRSIPKQRPGQPDSIGTDDEAQQSI